MISKPTNALRRLLTPRFSRAAKASKPNFRARLQVTSLEDRVTPASYIVTNVSGDIATPGSLPFFINAANLDNDDSIITFDSVVFGTAKTISLTTAMPQISDNQSMTIVGPGTGLLTVQRDSGAVGAFRVLDSDNRDLNLSGFTVSAGTAAAGGLGAFAGGNLTNMVFSGNNASDFGTIYVQSASTLNLVDSIVSGNNSARGAGIFVATTGTLNVIKSTISGNASSGNGGGIWVGNFATANVTDSTISGNTAGAAGGGIYMGAYSSLAVKNSTISGNTAATSGGGIYFVYAGNLLVENSTISGNITTGTANNAGGAGIYFYYAAGSVEVRNSTIANNTSASSGGGILLRYFYGDFQLKNVTVSGNSAANTNSGQGGGGIAVLGGPGRALIANSVIAMNSSLNGPEILGPVGAVSSSSSLIFNNSGYSESDGTGNVGLGINPQLGALTNNGGPTLTMLPAAGSPLVNNGNDNSTPIQAFTDQRGFGYARTFGQVDIGAVERQPDLPVALASVTRVDSSNIGESEYFFDVTFAQPNGANNEIDVSTIIGMNDVILVTFPGGATQLATYVNIDNGTDGSPRVATYKIVPPGGTWDSADNGDYLVSIIANKVFSTDAIPFAVQAGPIGIFNALVGPFVVTSVLDNGGPGTLRAAIALAGSTLGDDEIIFDPALFTSGPRTINLSATLAIGSGGGGVSIVGPGASDLILDGGDAFRVIDSSAPTLELSGFTVTNGLAAGAVPRDFGGGIRARGFVTLDGMVVTENASNGTGNLESGGGGIGMFSDSFLIVRNSTISDNTAVSKGAGIYFYAVGALGLAAGSLLVENSTISGNRSTPTAAYYGGGGIFFYRTPSSTVPSPDFVPGTIVIRNSTIANNQTTGSGGGFLGLVQGGTLLVQNSTISGNSADAAGAAYGGGGIALLFSTAQLVLQNSIVAGNTSASVNKDIRSTVGSATNSAIGDTTGFTFTDNGGNKLNQVFVLGPLADNGGPTQTMAPVAGGPLVDAGNDALVPLSQTTDQIGGTHQRKFGTVDIGAFEVQPPEVTIDLAAGQLNLVTAGPILFDINFDATVTKANLSPISISDFTIGGTYTGNLNATLTKISATSYQIAIAGLDAGDSGTITVTIAANTVFDGSGSGNALPTIIDNEVIYDDEDPTATITQTTTPVVQLDPTNSTTISFDVTFNEDVTDFDAADVDTTLSTVGIAGVNIIENTPQNYTVEVTLTGVPTEGDVIITVPAGAAVDAAGNFSEAATILDNTVHYDAVAPTVTVSRIGGTTAFGSSVQFNVVFSEDVVGFTAVVPTQIAFSGSATGSFTTSVTGSGSTYVVTVSGFTAGGTVTASILGAAGADAAGNLSVASTPGGNDTVTLINSGTVQFSAPTYIVDEFAGTTTTIIEVTRVGGNEGVLTVDYATIAGGTATASDDYDSASETLIFPNLSSTSQNIVITINDDTVFEPGNETVFLELSDVTVDAAAAPTALGAQSTATLTIDDFEAGTLSFSAPTYSVAESGTGAITTAVITVSRIDGFDGPVSIPYTMTLGTASLNDIGSPTTTPLMIPPNVLSWADGNDDDILINLPINDDTLSEGRETVNFALTSGSVTGNALLGTTAAILTIDQSDPIILNQTTKFTKVTDTDGDVATVKFTSKVGTVNVYKTNDAGPISIIETIGTDSTSTVAVTVLKVKKPAVSDGRVSIGEVVGTGLKSFSATKSDLVGVGVNLSGYLGSLAVADIPSGGNIIFGAGLAGNQKTKLTLGIVGDDTDIEATGAGLGGISTLSAISFGDGSITATSADSISIPGRKAKKATNTMPAIPAIVGNFGADVNLTGAAARTDGTFPATLGKLTVAGSILTGANLDVNGYGTTFKVSGSVETGADIDVIGTLRSLTVGTGTKVVADLDVLDGTFSAASVGSITVNGNLLGDITISGAGVVAGKPTLGSLRVVGKFDKTTSTTVGGTINGSTITVGSDVNVGNITSVTAVNFLNSSLFAGYNDATDVFKQVLADKKTVGTIGSFTVSGLTDAFANSHVFASTLKTVTLGSVKTDNGTVPFGFTADVAINSLKIGKTVFFKSLLPKTETDVDFSVQVL